VVEIVALAAFVLLPSYAMRDVLISLLAGLASTLRTRASLQVEILALRHPFISNVPRRRIRFSFCLDC